jgi:hypothetical protein
MGELGMDEPTAIRLAGFPHHPPPPFGADERLSIRPFRPALVNSGNAKAKGRILGCRAEFESGEASATIINDMGNDSSLTNGSSSTV